jgi:hypothetical protein
MKMLDPGCSATSCLNRLNANPLFAEISSPGFGVWTAWASKARKQSSAAKMPPQQFAAEICVRFMDPPSIPGRLIFRIDFTNIMREIKRKRTEWVCPIVTIIGVK